MRCKICLNELEATYVGTDRKSSMLYKDKLGRYWKGKCCPDCYNVRVKEYRRAQSGGRCLKEVSCSLCGGVFSQRSYNQINCGKCEVKPKRRLEKLEKLCPACGASFMGQKRRVYCSIKCLRKRC